MVRIVRFLFFRVLVRTVVLLVLGLNVRHRERLPGCGPAILVANHNSHLDTMVLMTLFPWRQQQRIRPVAAGDYFLRNRLIAWFALRIIGIVPVDRSGRTPRAKLLDGVTAALSAGDSVIVFPEGTRGQPEHLDEFKTGVFHLSRANPGVPVVPIFLHGLGKVLPRGEALLVPFFCDVFVGEAMEFTGERDDFMRCLSARMQALADEGRFPPWE